MAARPLVWQIKSQATGRGKGYYVVAHREGNPQHVVYGSGPFPTKEDAIAAARTQRTRTDPRAPK